MKRQYKKKSRANWTDKIEKIMSPEELTSLQDLIIYQNTDGTYHLFDKYIIRKSTPQGFEVTSSVSDLTRSFCSLKNATAWCIFDKRDKFYESRRVAELDSRIGAIDFDIEVHLNMFRKAKSPDDQLVFIAKLNEDRIKKQMMSVELDSYTADSKNWQNNRFNRKPA